MLVEGHFRRKDWAVNEILFIDNSQKHLDSAKQLGWQTFLYDPSDTKKSSEELIKVI